nr:hypothetical protein CFP56_25248 [Quercus suber]
MSVESSKTRHLLSNSNNEYLPWPLDCTNFSLTSSPSSNSIRTVHGSGWISKRVSSDLFHLTAKVGFRSQFRFLLGNGFRSQFRFLLGNGDLF